MARRQRFATTSEQKLIDIIWQLRKMIYQLEDDATEAARRGIAIEVARDQLRLRNIKMARAYLSLVVNPRKDKRT